VQPWVLLTVGLGLGAIAVADRGVLVVWWLLTLVLGGACSAVGLVVGMGETYWALWLAMAAALSGVLREQAGRGSWWLVAGFEVLGPGVVALVIRWGGLPVGSGLVGAGVCGVVGVWCLSPWWPGGLVERC
jgi:hypothetical protein